MKYLNNGNEYCVFLTIESSIFKKIRRFCNASIIRHYSNIFSEGKLINNLSVVLTIHFLK